MTTNLIYEREDGMMQNEQLDKRPATDTDTCCYCHIAQDPELGAMVCVDADGRVFCSYTCAAAVHKLDSLPPAN